MKRTLILFIAALFSLPACRTQKVDTEIIEISELNYTPEDSARLAKLGVTLTKINSTQAILTKPAKKVGKVKFKNVGNTKAKGKAIIGDENISGKAKDGAAVGAGNVVEQEKGMPTWQKVTAGLALLLIAFMLWVVRKILR